MENQNKDKLTPMLPFLEKVGVYLACIATLFMFWQGWRELHRDSTALQERISKLEVKVENLEKKS